LCQEEQISGNQIEALHHQPLPMNAVAQQNQPLGTNFRDKRSQLRQSFVAIIRWHHLPAAGEGEALPKVKIRDDQRALGRHPNRTVRQEMRVNTPHADLDTLTETRWALRCNTRHAGGDPSSIS
jgi:hypothetical protein